MTPKAPDSHDSPDSAGRLLLNQIAWGADDFQLQADLSLELSRFYTVLGPSGCGKTTLLRLIAGLTAPQTAPGPAPQTPSSPGQGRILLDGRDIPDPPPHRRGIGMVFQHYSLFPHLSAGENIAYGLRRRGLSRRQRAERIREMLSLVNLTGREDRQVETLSGGEQQRIAIARALAPEPRVLLLDEPLSALDAPLRRRLRREIRRIQQDTGVTMIYVTHDQEEALSLADQVILMENGRVQETGSPEELYYTPGSLETAEALGQANILPTDSLPPPRRGERGWLFFRPDGLMVPEGHGSPAQQEPIPLGEARVEEREFTPTGYLYQLSWDNRILWMRLSRKRLEEGALVPIAVRPGAAHWIPHPSSYETNRKRS